MPKSNATPPWSFSESLPPNKRHLAWSPSGYLLLTLPCAGVATAWVQWRCLATGEMAWNVATYTAHHETAF